MKNIIKKAIEEALNKNEIIFEQEIKIEIPANKTHGDFSSNIALLLAKQLKNSPINIANQIKDSINNDKITKIEVVNPGFINFFVDKSYLIENINTVISQGENYGRSTIGNNKKINVEFVSANPTGILHMGNARGGAYGDSLAKILNFAGYNATKEYYVNDAGNQINNLGLSLQARYHELCGIDARMPEDGYYGKEIIEYANKLYEENQDTLKDRELDYFKEIATADLLERIKAVLKEYRVEYDVFTSEKKVYEKGTIPSILQELEKKGHTTKVEGATWFKSSEFGDTKDHVLVKADGTYTYLVPDIAYHIDKIQRGYDRLIDVLGTDHHGYVARLKGSLQALGHPSDLIDVKLLQLVRLVKDGQEVKMSKRTGNAISLKELIEEIGVNAARYFFASRSLDTQMDFDLELAKKKTSENPVYYISYAHARISTILNENKRENIQTYTTINESDAYNVLEKVYMFKSVVEAAATKELPHLVANYVHELANLFHTFYSNNRIIVEDQTKTQENLNMILAVKITIYNALNLIGVIPPERM